MKTRIAVATGVAALSLSLSTVAQAPQTMRPGLWEFTTNFSMPGGKKGATQTRKHQQCITPAEVKDKSAFKSQIDPKMGCSMSDFKQDGSKFSYKVACKGQMAMTGTVNGDATPDAMTMNMEMDMSAMKGMGTMKQAVTARRLGECTT